MNLSKEQKAELMAIKTLYPWAKYIFRNNEKYSNKPYYLLCLTSHLPIVKNTHIEPPYIGKCCQIPNALLWVNISNGIIDIDEEEHNQ